MSIRSLYMLPVAATSLLLSLNTAHAGSIEDIDHVVLFMQENRAFDHYFGTLAGVRGFSDPNVQLNDGVPVWKQSVDALLTTNATYLNPWYLNYLGGYWLNATQCMVAGNNGWTSNHESYDYGLNDHWAISNTPWSWAHFQRSDIPVQFAIADGWTIGDMYQESVIASTNPNRVTWISGSINVPGGPQTADEGGDPYIDNNETPGCDDDGINCYPLKWLTSVEFYEQAGVSWQIYQDADNFDDNPLAWFEQFQDASNSSDLYKRGFQGLTLDTFYAQAANGTLPEISYIIGPTQLSEHPPYSPRDGAWLEKQVVDAVTSSPKYNRTALIISFDETGGFGDHVTPYHSPNGTAGEWLEDPWAGTGYTFAGPGFRVPFYIVSPWTRGGAVFTEHADHNSQLLFIEQWQAAKGRNVTTTQMTPWRRAHMSDLTAAFDFAHPRYDVPELPYAIPPHTSDDGTYDGSSYCESLYPVQNPPVPYVDQVDDVSSLSEPGYKEVRGALTEGRWLVFEAAERGRVALTNAGSGTLTTSPATPDHESRSQRWVAHVEELGSDKFSLSSAVDGAYVTADATLSATTTGDLFTVSFQPGSGYALQNAQGGFLVPRGNGCIGFSTQPTYWKAYSVTYGS